ncbi:MAG: hypothetical protein NTY48_00280 [Candidatus Diapherotrites archaeon]|nr:hypothetical protein [Candidatus Diapherotrites archaeon]
MDKNDLNLVLNQFHKHFTSCMDKDIPEFLYQAFHEPRPKLEYAYFFSQTKDNEDSAFKATREIKEKELAEKFVIDDSKPWLGYSGYASWKTKMSFVGAENIVGIPLPSETYHTVMEAEAIISFAKEKGISNMYISAPPFHLPRAFLSAISCALRNYKTLNFFAYPGAVLDWNEEVVHNQGLFRAKRIDFMKSELERIDKYQRKGDLVSARDALNYIKNRNATSLAKE